MIGTYERLVSGTSFTVRVSTNVRRILVTLAVLVVAVVGYYFTGPGPRWRGAEVLSVAPTESGLWVGVQTCGGQRRVRLVEESSTRVVLQAWIRWDTDDDCDDLGDEEIDLAEPLGERQVIDRETGEVVTRRDRY